MPNIKSAKKRMKTSEAARVRNRSAKSTVATTRTKLFDAIGAGDRTQCDKLLRTYFSVLDKAVKKGTLTANTASRRKSRAVARVKAL